MLVHDPEAEKKFIDEGHGINRREIAWNDFVIVGPGADPARIKGGRDVISAFKAIWKAQAPFVSRGDKSGTDALEKRLWKAADLDVGKASAQALDLAALLGELARLRLALLARLGKACPPGRRPRDRAPRRRCAQPRSCVRSVP